MITTSVLSSLNINCHTASWALNQFCKFSQARALLRFRQVKSVSEIISSLEHTETPAIFRDIVRPAPAGDSILVIHPLLLNKFF